MALVKSWPDPTSESPEPIAYLRLADVHIQPIARSILLRFAVYRDEGARRAGRAPFDSIEVRTSGDDYDAFAEGQAGTVDSIGALAYGFAKAQPDLIGAEDA